MKFKDFRMRDPFVFTHDGKYYLTGTELQKSGVEVYSGNDCESWENPVEIFSIAPDSWAKCDIWAPEIHFYQGKFYLFVSLLGKNGLRGTQIAVSDTVQGRYTPVINAPSTPLSQSCIDGTLYVENGVPYIVYSHDWPDNLLKSKGYYEGEICAARLKDDFTGIIGEPLVLFGGASPVWAKRNHIDGYPYDRFGTDGPFFHKLSNGKLLLLWSPMVGNNYVVAGAVSENGIKGPWKHLEEWIFGDNGGHGSLFTDFDGQLNLTIHAPENWGNEHGVIYPVKECGDTLKIKKKAEK